MFMTVWSRVVGKNLGDNQMNVCLSLQPVRTNVEIYMKSFAFALWCQYLLLVDFGPSSNAETDGLNIPATYSQMEGTALGLV